MWPECKINYLLKNKEKYICATSIHGSDLPLQNGVLLLFTFQPQFFLYPSSLLPPFATPPPASVPSIHFSQSVTAPIGNQQSLAY